MKVLKFIGSFIIGILLFVLLFAFSIILRTKNFVEKELVLSVVKETAIQNIDNEDMTEEQRAFLEKITSDKDAEKIVEKAVSNYLAFTEDNNHKISEDDYNFLLDFIIKYKDDLNTISNTNYDEKYIRNQFKYEDFNKAVSETFKNLDKEEASTNVSDIITLYSKTTSSKTLLIFVLSIVVCILLLMLINWSFIRWILVLGIDLIPIGMIITGFYIAWTYIKTQIEADEKVLEIVNNINVSGFLIMGIVEIVMGIGLIIVYCILRKREN